VLENPAHTGDLGRGKGSERLQKGVLPQELIGTRDCGIAAGLGSMNHGLS